VQTANRPLTPMALNWWTAVFIFISAGWQTVT